MNDWVHERDAEGEAPWLPSSTNPDPFVQKLGGSAAFCQTRLNSFKYLFFFMDANDLAELFTRHCKVYDLEHVRSPKMPGSKKDTGLQYYLFKRHEDFFNTIPGEGRTGSFGLIIMSDQSGTHIDARCHQGRQKVLYGNTPVTAEIQTPWGFTRLGADEIPPLIGRCVLLDFATYARSPIENHHEVSLDEFKDCANKEGVEIRGNDVVLLRTGYSKHFGDDSLYRLAPGASKEVSAWLAEKKVLAVGADNSSWDVPISEDSKEKPWRHGHLILLVKEGIYIMENLNLEQLSSDRRYESLFIGLPPKFKGATGSPIRPIAIVPV